MNTATLYFCDRCHQSYGIPTQEHDGLCPACVVAVQEMNKPQSPVAPAKHTVGGVMVSQLHHQKMKCDELTDMLFVVRPHLENFESGSAEIWQEKFWIHLHRPKSVEAAKEFCRAWGGQWTQTNDNGSIIYRCNDDRGAVHIHRVGEYNETPLAL